MDHTESFKAAAATGWRMRPHYKDQSKPGGFGSAVKDQWAGKEYWLSLYEPWTRLEKVVWKAKNFEALYQRCKQTQDSARI